MDTLQDKLEEYFGDMNAIFILEIIANHMEWTDPIQCRFGHVYSGSYEITQEANLYFMRTYLSSHDNIDAAKTAAQAHKEGK